MTTTFAHLLGFAMGPWPVLAGPFVFPQPYLDDRGARKVTKARTKVTTSQMTVTTQMPKKGHHPDLQNGVQVKEYKR